MFVMLWGREAGDVCAITVLIICRVAWSGLVTCVKE